MAGGEGGEGGPVEEEAGGWLGSAINPENTSRRTTYTMNADAKIARLLDSVRLSIKVFCFVGNLPFIFLRMVRPKAIRKLATVNPTVALATPDIP